MRILLAGASIATLSAAKELRTRLPRADIILINRRAHVLHRRHVPHLLSGLHAFEHERIDLARFCEKQGIRFLLSDIKTVEPRERVVYCGEQRLAYDALLLDLPDEPSAAHHHGAESVLPLGGEASAHALRAHLVQELVRTAKTAHDKHRTTVIVGNDARSMETAAEIRSLLERGAIEHLVFPDELRTILLAMERDDHNAIPLSVRAKLLRALNNHGVETHEPTHVQYEHGRLHIDGRLTETDSVVWTGALRGNRLFIGAELAVDEHGYVLVDRALRTSDDRVFALGHSIKAVGDIPIPSHRRAKDFVLEGRIAAKNITATLNGKTLTPIGKTGKAPRLVTIGKTAFAWFGPFTLHGEWPLALHRASERRAFRSVQK
jgi:NADH dehydrogenase